MKLLLATTNRGKLIELKRILDGRSSEILSLEGLGAGDAEENGQTFADNALIKARHYHALFGLPTVADDSGIEVDALGGSPGVTSARYAGVGASDADRNEKLLAALDGVPHGERGARYVCAAAIVWNGGERVFEGEVTGSILERPRGDGGFGYDPVFYYQPFGRTFAELTPEEKDKISHRGIAFRRLAKWLGEQGKAA